MNPCRARAVSLLFVVAVAGCAVGPDHRRPDASALLPAFGAAVEMPAVAAGPPASDHARWWTAFHDPMLDALVQDALQSNRDLAIAAARVREVRALYGVTAAGAYPAIGAAGLYSRSRTSENTPQSRRSGMPGGVTTDLFQAGFDAAWEIDIFGALPRETEAAQAEIDASIEGGRQVLVTLLAEIARNYVELRGIQHQLAVTGASAEAQRQTFRLASARHAAGLVTYADVARAMALVAETEAQTFSLEKAARQASNRIAVLIGAESVGTWKRLAGGGKIPVHAAGIGAGIPAELLRRRPDIRKAEREIAAASARIGVAIADLYPRFSLTGTFGLSGEDAADLSLASSRFWSLGPAVKWPLFAGGRIRSNIALREARHEQSLLRYEQTVATAVEEVENALFACARETARQKALATAAAAAGQARDIAGERYAKGLADYLQVLDAERSRLAAENQLAQSRAAQAGHIVALYKALGGGWDEALPSLQ